MKYDNTAIDIAAKHNRVEVLQWWFREYNENNLKIMYSSHTIDNAASQGHLNIIELFAQFDKKIHYLHAVDFASGKGNISILDWFYDYFDGDIHFTDDAFDLAIIYGHLNSLNWFYDKFKEDMIFSLNHIKLAFKYKQKHVIDWLYEKYHSNCNIIDLNDLNDYDMNENSDLENTYEIERISILDHEYDVNTCCVYEKTFDGNIEERTHIFYQ